MESSDGYFDHTERLRHRRLGDQPAYRLGLAHLIRFPRPVRGFPDFRPRAATRRAETVQAFTG
jgi:hypothetical protein